MSDIRLLYMCTCNCLQHLDQLFVTLAPLVGYAGKVRVPLLAVAPHDPAVIELVLLQVAFRVVVAVDVDLGQSVVGSRLLNTLMHTALQPRKKQLQPEGGEGGEGGRE